MRDFFSSGLAFLMNGEPDLVKNFLLMAVQLQGTEKRVDCFTLGEGVMPASFKVHPLLEFTFLPNNLTCLGICWEQNTPLVKRGATCFSGASLSCYSFNVAAWIDVIDAGSLIFVSSGDVRSCFQEGILGS